MPFYESCARAVRDLQTESRVSLRGVSAYLSWDTTRPIGSGPGTNPLPGTEYLSVNGIWYRAAY